MRPISRRRALQLGGLGLAGAVVGGAGLARTINAGSRLAPVVGVALTEPAVLRSSNGTLDLRLEAAETRVRLAGRDATVLSFNGGVPGPTLYLQPGDRLRVDLANRLTTPTNLHTHGLQVSPQGNSDNPFVSIDPGQTFHYDIELPRDHPAGVYWYHPHLHGHAADQVYGGLYGAIIVADPTPLPVTADRVLVISDISLDSGGLVRPVSAAAKMMGREGDLVLVNGQAQPQLTARPGERHRWRVINACTARYLRLRLDGQQLHVLGIDSGRYSEPREVSEILLVPGNRADLLVTTREGSSQLRALPYNRGGMGMAMGRGNGATDPGEHVLATLAVTGATAPAAPPLQAQAAPRDLRDKPVSARRRLTFAAGMAMGMGSDGLPFTIDGKSFDHTRVDQTTVVGAVEEWVVTNTSPMDHPLHLHVWPMQIIEQNGIPRPAPAWQDVVNLPARSTTTLRVAFDRFAGRTVYHCHILDHEDKGMMGVIEAR